MASNDHFISRFLTRPWERGKNRQLRFFDFGSETFQTKRTEKLFRARRLNKSDTERFLSEEIERPCAEFQARLLGSVNDDEFREAFDEAPLVPLTALFWLQAERLKDAEARRATGKAESLESRMDRQALLGREGLEQLASAFWETDRPHLVLLPAGERLFFPENAYVGFPQAGAPPVLGLPFGIRVLLLWIPIATKTENLEAQIRTSGRAAAMSVGIDERSRRVLIPPDIEDPPPEFFHTMRKAARELINLYAEASAEFGLAAWSTFRDR